MKWYARVLVVLFFCVIVVNTVLGIAPTEYLFLTGVGGWLIHHLLNVNASGTIQKETKQRRQKQKRWQKLKYNSLSPQQKQRVDKIIQDI